MKEYKMIDIDLTEVDDFSILVSEELNKYAKDSWTVKASYLAIGVFLLERDVK